MIERKSTHGCLAFVGASYKQKSDAATCFPDKWCKCLLWEDVFTALSGIKDRTPLLQEFLAFMSSHGLGPAPSLTVDEMRAFLRSSSFIASLHSLANRLCTEFSWDVMPARYRGEPWVHNGYGRVAIRFATPEWMPVIAIGFLFDESDHKVSLVNRDKGIDLLLRIEAEPKHSKKIEPVLAVLEAKRSELKKTAASVLVRGERENGNPWSVLIVRSCLGDLIEGLPEGASQLAVIHDTVDRWLRVLFDDGTLERACKKCGLDSGMA